MDNKTLPQPPDYYVAKLRDLQTRMRDHLLHHLREQDAALHSDTATATLADPTDTRGGDTIYRIDERGEEILADFCHQWATEAPFVLIAEGIEGAGWLPFPAGASADEAIFLLIVDPIDGTRNIMYNKRSAWILSGIAPNRGTATTLADIAVAAMTEVPTTRALLADQLWATEGGGAYRETHNLMTGGRQMLPLRPSQAPNLAHGFASLAKFFPSAKGATGALEEALLSRVAPEEGENPLVFDDQYISTGGQLYELMVGHDRFLADLRPLMYRAAGLPTKLVCHPYDICVELIAREAGVLVTDERGNRLAAPLDIQAPVTWAGYANLALQRLIASQLQIILQELGLY